MTQITSDRQLIQFHERCILTARPDAKGRWEIGWGHDIAPPLPGAGAPTCTQDAADAWLDADLALARQRAATALGQAWESLDEVRRAVLADMAYELGGAGLSLFKEMLTSIMGQRYLLAAQQGLESLWAEQVPNRAKMDMDMLAEGKWPSV